jgi:hypothetical protein
LFDHESIGRVKKLADRAHGEQNINFHHYNDQFRENGISIVAGFARCKDNEILYYGKSKDAAWRWFV